MSQNEKARTNSDLFKNKKLVLRAGIEPARPEGHRILSPVRLPIPPPKHEKKISTTRF